MLFSWIPRPSTDVDFILPSTSVPPLFFMVPCHSSIGPEATEEQQTNEQQEQASLVESQHHEQQQEEQQEKQEGLVESAHHEEYSDQIQLTAPAPEHGSIQLTAPSPEHGSIFEQLVHSIDEAATWFDTKRQDLIEDFESDVDLVEISESPTPSESGDEGELDLSGELDQTVFGHCQ